MLSMESDVQTFPVRCGDPAGSRRSFPDAGVSRDPREVAVRQDDPVRRAGRRPAVFVKNAIGKAASYRIVLGRKVASNIAERLKMRELKISYVSVTADTRFDAIASNRADLLF